MEQVLQALSEIRQDLPWANFFAALLLIVLAQVLFRIFDHFLHIFVENKSYRSKVLSFRKLSLYIYNLILFLLFLKVMQVEMKVVLGATGLLTLAIGFAARTPISNLISGLFLVFERPFVVGSVIKVGEHTGEVVSRNLLSLTMRTLDNLMVRIPNEVVIGSAVSNLSHFPIRRLEIPYLLSNRESMTRLEEIFKTVADRNPLALNEPAPYFYVKQFFQNHTEVIFQVWCPSEDFLSFQAQFPQELHRSVKNAGIEPIRNTVEIYGPVELSSQTGEREKS
jgi:small-conductance mechanosensitive channel